MPNPPVRSTSQTRRPTPGSMVAGEPGARGLAEGSVGDPPDAVGPVGTTGAQPPVSPTTRAMDAAAKATNRDQRSGGATRETPALEPRAS